MLPNPLRFLHRFILINFIIEIAYGVYMVFFGVAGRKGPLFNQAEDLPVEAVVKRRLYAIETWVAISGLAAYVGITEVLPRRLKADETQDRRSSSKRPENII